MRWDMKEGYVWCGLGVGSPNITPSPSSHFQGLNSFVCSYSIGSIQFNDGKWSNQHESKLDVRQNHRACGCVCVEESNGSQVGPLKGNQALIFLAASWYIFINNMRILRNAPSKMGAFEHSSSFIVQLPAIWYMLTLTWPLSLNLIRGVTY